MSTDSNGRYQSRLFKFLQSRSLQVAESCQRVVRQLKVATVWGVQVVLYPLYAFLQNSHNHPSLEADIPEHPSQLPTGEEPENEPQAFADKPIQRVLRLTQKFVRSNQRPQKHPTPQNRFNLKELISSWHQRSVQSLPAAQETALLPALPGSAFILHPPLQEKSAIIRGIASELTTRSLVLTSTDNKTLDVLTGQQQQQLRWQIRREVAEFPVWQKFAQLQRRFSTPTLPASNGQPLPPGQIWQGLITRLQPGPLAIATQGEKSPPMESGNLAALSEASWLLGQRSWELMQKLRQRAQQIALGTISPEKSALIEPTGTRPQIAPQLDQTNRLQIQSWIRTAIAHFFSQGRGELTIQTPDTPAIAPPVKIPPIPTTGNPEAKTIETWLTLRDLFGDYGKIETQPWEEQPTLKIPPAFNPSNLATPPALPASQVTEFVSLNRWQQLVETAVPRAAIATPERTQDTITAPEPVEQLSQQPEVVMVQSGNAAIASELARIATASNAIAKIESTAPTPSKTADLLEQLLNQNQRQTTVDEQSQILSTLRETSTRQNAEITPAESFEVTASPQKPELEFTSEWLEAQAVSMGYVKHPLELMLQRLDQIMLWLENSAIASGQWLKDTLSTAFASTTESSTEFRWQQLPQMILPKLSTATAQLWQQCQQWPAMTEVIIPLGQSLQEFWQNTVWPLFQTTFRKFKERFGGDRVKTADPTDE